MMALQKIVSPVKTGVQCFDNYYSKLLDVLARFAHSASLRSSGWSLPVPDTGPE
jgi:hypothetical protein